MIGRVANLFRFLLALICSAALLYTLSYPDNILPRDPYQESLAQLTLYDFKPLLFLPPTVLLVFVCLGRGGARIMFSAMGSVLICGILSIPVLEAHRPELLHRTFTYQHHALDGGLIIFALTLLGLLCAYGFIRFLRPTPPETSSEANTVDAAELAPEKGRTVQEIVANPIRVKPRFLFGDPDMALIDRFYHLTRALLRRRGITTAGWGLAALCGLLWLLFYPTPDTQQALERDLELMRQIQPNTQSQPKATAAAVHAAYRVMRYIQDNNIFTGMTPQQAEDWLRLSKIPANYRCIMRDESDIELSSVDTFSDYRTRFLTVTDGKRYAVLFIRTNADGSRINVAEVQDAGWDAVADENRKYYGNSVRINY